MLISHNEEMAANTVWFLIAITWQVIHWTGMNNLNVSFSFENLFFSQNHTLTHFQWSSESINVNMIEQNQKLADF